MNDSMKGLFFIVKGQYTKGLSPEYTNEVTGEVSYVGGYDPDRSTTQEWYRLLDRHSFQCYFCGSDYRKVLEGVRTLILKYKGSARKYFRYVSQTTSDDYYEVHYLGRPELTQEERAKKVRGKCPRMSPTMRCMCEEIYKWYGDYYRPDIEKMEEEAYAQLVDEIPVNRTRKLMQRMRKNSSIQETSISAEPPKEDTSSERRTPSLIRPQRRPIKLLRV